MWVQERENLIMKTSFAYKKRIAAVLLGLSALVTGCGANNGQNIGYVPGENLISGCGAAALGTISFTGMTSVTPLLQMGQSVYSFSGTAGPGSYALMQVGGAGPLGGREFISNGPDGSLRIWSSIPMNEYSTAYTGRQMQVSGAMTLSSASITAVQLALGGANMADVCVSRIELRVTSTQGNDLVGAQAFLTFKSRSSGAEMRLPNDYRMPPFTF